MAKWGFGRRNTTQPAQTVDDATRGSSSEKDGPSDPESTWWLGPADPSRVINRRWRSPRPDALHPRRRADDAPPPRDVGGNDAARPFDPDALLVDQARNPSVDDVAEHEASDPGTRLAPWAALDLDSDATWDEIVTRHRELAKQHHPDRAGADRAAAAVAAERMAQINAAFAELGKIYKITGDR